MLLPSYVLQRVAPAVNRKLLVIEVVDVLLQVKEMESETKVVSSPKMTTGHVMIGRAVEE